MKQYLLLALFTFFTLISTSSMGEDLWNKLECSSGFFSSIQLVRQGESYFLEGVQYPEITTTMIRTGYLFREIRTAEIIDGLLYLVQELRNEDKDWILEHKYFVLNTETLQFSSSTVDYNVSYKKGIQKYKEEINQMLEKWWSSSDGICNKK